MSNGRPAKNNSISILFLTLGISFVLIGTSGHAQVKVKGKKRDIQETQREAPHEGIQKGISTAPAIQDEAQLPERYESLLVKYLVNIDRLRREQRETAIREYQERLRLLQTQAEQLQEREAQVLADLLKEAQTRHGKIDFEGECYENRMGILIPTSNASAKIFAQLYRSNVLNAENMMQLVSKDSQILSAEWIELIKKIADNANNDEEKHPLRDTCVKTLYRAGVSCEMYRPMLRRMAEQNHDVSAVEALFFRVNPETGELEKVVTYDNLTLMKALAQPDQPPEIRAACAHYATRLHDYQLAMDVCFSLLEQPYQGIVQRVHKAVPEDIALFRARRAAMHVMFCGIRNEKCFETIYARSRISIAEAAEHVAGDDDGWVSFKSYILGEWEIEAAQSLVSTVREQNGGTLQ